MTKRNIKIRHVDFGIQENIPNRWYLNNLPVSHFVNSLHLIFPDGEKFFIRSVKAHEHFIQDEELKKKVKAFIAQEVLHGKEHKKFWQTLENQGYDIDTFLNFYNKTCYNDAEKFVNNFLGEKYSLSVTVALEHFTASLAQFVFEDMDNLEGMPEEMRKMLLWHAGEEIEHKSVAFDVLKNVDDSYFLRLYGISYAIITLSFYTLTGFFLFLMQDLKKGEKIGIMEWFGFFQNFWKLISSIGPKLLEYFYFDFHPDQMQNDHLASRFFSENNIEKDKIPA